MTQRKDRNGRRKSDPGTLSFRPAQDRMTMAAELPWGAPKMVPITPLDYNSPSGSFVGQSMLFDLYTLFEKKLHAVTVEEPVEKLLNKSLQRGGDATMDNLCRSLAAISEVCLPSVLDSLIRWHGALEKGISEKLASTPDPKPVLVKKVLATHYLFCLVLIEVLPQLEFHRGTCDQYVKQIIDLAFKQIQYKDPASMGQNHTNNLIVAEIFAEVLGVISESRFSLVHKNFIAILNELRNNSSSSTTNSVVALLMAMKFVKIKTNQVDDFEVGIKFLEDLAGYFIEVKDKDIKHAVAGLLVEILLPVAAQIKREANIPALITFVGRLYGPTNELVSKKAHRLAAYPLLTCLLCVSQKPFFLANWVPFLNNALASLKNRDSRVSRVALESLYRLLWVYMIRNTMDGNLCTRTRLESICGSLFPKGNRAVVPRDAPLNIFVKIIHFIAQQKLDFAFKEVIFDLLCCNRTQRSLYPERMNIGLRALMVIADGLQQRDEPPAMPKSMGPSASGTMHRIKKKTYITRPLTVEIARSIGLDQYYIPCRKAFDSILRILDAQVGKPLMLTAVQRTKEPEELLGGEVKPKLDLFRTCVAAIPRLLPEPMSHNELVEIITRLTIHVDDELRNMSGMTLQAMIGEFPEWRESIIMSLIQLINTNLTDFYPSILDDALRLLLQLLTTWKLNAAVEKKKEQERGLSTVPELPTSGTLYVLNYANVLHAVEGVALVMLCQMRVSPRKVAISLLKEVKAIINVLALDNCDIPVITVLDDATPYVIKKYIEHVPLSERMSWTMDFASACEKISALETTDNCLINMDRGNEYLQWDAWACALSGYSERQFLLSKCPTAVQSAWPMLFSRLNLVHSHVDPSNPQNESRASLLRGSKSKASSVCGEVLSQEGCLSLWQKYLTFCCAFAPSPPHSASMISRSFSPTSSIENDVLRSVSSSLRGIRPPPTLSLAQLLSKITTMLRWENMTDLRDNVVLGVGSLNPHAFESLLDELNRNGILREAQEKKPETNVRRRKRKDLLRLQILRIVEVAVWRGLLQATLSDTGGCLNGLLVEFIESMRINLEVDQDRDVVVLTSLRLHFAKLSALIVESVAPDARGHLFPEEKKQSLFYLFMGWCSRVIAGDKKLKDAQVGSYVEQKSITAMARILCCGPVFETTKSIGDDGYLYGWLDKLISSPNPSMQNEVEEMLALMLELNESSNLLDWILAQCYQQTPGVAARCFRALVRVFSKRDFPCEFISLFVLCQTMVADPSVSDVAVHMIELLRRQFLDNGSSSAPTSAIPSALATSSPSVALRNAVLSPISTSDGHCYPIEQAVVCRQLAKNFPHLSITIFSEVCFRLEKARSHSRSYLLQLLLPWIENLELMDVVAGEDACEGPRGWGSEEATQLLLNNLFCLTAQLSSEHEHDLSELWRALAVAFPANLPVILNYLYVVTVLSHETLLFYAKRVCVMLSGAVGNRLASVLLEQLTASMDASKLMLERTEIPPFYRWKDDLQEKRDISGEAFAQDEESQQEGVKLLPMPAYGGHYSQLSAFLPPITQPIQSFARSQVALLLICDVIRASSDVDWTEATPRLLHSAVLNLDSLRPILCRHARQTIINVCLLYADTSVIPQVSSILLRNQMSSISCGATNNEAFALIRAQSRDICRGESPAFTRATEVEYRNGLLKSNALFSSSSDLLKAIAFCLSENMDQPLWANEDATPRNWRVPSSQELSCLVLHLAEYLLERLPLLAVVWTQTAVRMALVTPQRHLAGRCFQIVSSLCQPPCAWIPGMISRLVETAGEQHEDTQAYVTDLLICLSNSVAHLNPVIVEPPPLPSPTHARSTSYTPALLRQSVLSQKIQNERKDARLSLLISDDQPWVAAAMIRSKSAEQLKSDGETDEEANARMQMCAIAVALLDSGLENEFMLAVCLLEKVLATAGSHKLQCVQKLEKLIGQLEWKGFQGIVQLLVRGSILPGSLESSLQAHIQLLDVLDERVVGGPDSLGLVVSHMLPYMLLHFDSPNKLSCDCSTAIQQYCVDVVCKAGSPADHPFTLLATVLSQYNSKTFSKDRWQWTKCVVQYLCDGIDRSMITSMMVLLAEILDRGPVSMQVYILHILYLLVLQSDTSDPAKSLPVNAQVVRLANRHSQGSNWREASRLNKAILEQWRNAELDKNPKSDVNFELDISLIIGYGSIPDSPRKSVADTTLKRPPPHIRVRDRLVALLSASGLRVGLPPAQSVVFSHSELVSPASSTERICTSSQEVASTNSLHDPSITDSFPRVFKEFDFLEAEHDSISETAESCFGWLSTMRPHSIGETRQQEDGDEDEDSESAMVTSESADAQSRNSRNSECSSEEKTPCPSEIGDDLDDDIDGDDGFDAMSAPTADGATCSSVPLSPPPLSRTTFDRKDDDLVEEESRDGSRSPHSIEYFPNRSVQPLLVQCAHHCDHRIDQQWAGLLPEIADDVDGEMTAFATLLLTQLFRTCCARVMTMLRDSSVLFSSRPIARAISGAQDVVARIVDCPFLFVSAQFLRCSGVQQRLRYCLYEMREHVETFNERKEQCLRALNSMRSAYKLSALGGSTSSLQGQSECDLGKLLSKLFFQLMQMNDTFQHMIQLIEESPSAQMYSLSPAVLDHHRELLQCMSEMPSPSTEQPSTSSGRPEHSPDSLVLLMTNKRYVQALQMVRLLRSTFGGQFGCCDQVDVDILLLAFCRCHAVKAWAVVGSAVDAVRRQSDALRDANADLVTATASRRPTTDAVSQRTGTLSSRNDSFSKLSYHAEL